MIARAARGMERELGRAAAAAWEAWCGFWFESNRPAQMRFFRASVGWTMFALYFARTFDLEFLFGSSGLLPIDVMKAVLPVPMRPSLLQLFPGAGALWLFHGLFLASLLSLALGYKPRLSAAAAFVLHISFIHRNMLVVYGADLISVFYLLYLCIADEKNPRSMLGSMAVRLIQIQMSIIYGYSGMEKLRGASWWTGDALWEVMANNQLSRFDLSWLAHFPALIVAATYLTVLWETYFPALVWVRPLRVPVLLCGVLLHLGIALTINIPFFSLIMIISYVLFLDDRQLTKLVTFLRSLQPKKLKFL